jgi:hypothetical protein
LEILFQKTKLVHGLRSLDLDKADKRKINEEDINKGLELFLKDKNKAKDNNFIYNMYT